MLFVILGSSVVRDIRGDYRVGLRLGTEPRGNTTSGALAWNGLTPLGKRPAHCWAELIRKLIAGDPGASASVQRSIPIGDVRLWPHGHDPLPRKADQTVTAEVAEIRAVEDDQVRAEGVKCCGEIVVEETRGPTALLAIEELKDETPHSGVFDGDQHARAHPAPAGRVHSPIFAPPDVAVIR